MGEDNRVVSYGASRGLSFQGVDTLRATPQSFTGASNQTVQVDMHIDTGVR
jgi:hypothetical protein